MAKTWKEKLEAPKTPEVQTLEKPYGGAPPGARMLIATPGLVDQYMRQVPRGEVRSIAALHEDLARSHGADLTCHLTTGIFARIAAEAALEQAAAGEPVEQITPFWRVVEPESPLAKKLSCGAAFIREQRAREGTS